MNKKWIHIAFCVCLVLAALLASGRTAFAQPLDNGTDVVVSVLSESNTGEFRFKVNVTNLDGNSLLHGCQFQLTTGRVNESEIICDTDDFTESPTGVYSFTCQLEYGRNYYLYEKVTPSNYDANKGSYYAIKIDKDGEVFYRGEKLSVSTDGSTYELTVRNCENSEHDYDSGPSDPMGYLLTSVDINKIDAETKEYLSGAEFTARSKLLTGSEPYAYRTSYATNEVRYYGNTHSHYQFSQIRINNEYELQETQAPAGYKKDDTIYTMTIDDNKRCHIYKPDGSELEKIDGIYTISNKTSDLTSKQVSLDSSGFTDSAAITENKQPYTYRLSYRCSDGSKRPNLVLYDEIENGSKSCFAGTVTGIDLTGYGGIPVDVYVRGVGADTSVPDVFEKFPGGKDAGWQKIDPDTFSQWSKVTHVALYTEEFDSTKRTHVYADIKMASNLSEKNKPVGDKPPEAVTITFGPDCRTESSSYDNEGSSYDYVRIYYRKSGKIYTIHQSSWKGFGGSDLANKSVNIPSNDFWIYWHTDGSSCKYYGFDVASVTAYDGDEFMTGYESVLPNYAIEDTADVSALTSAFDSDHPHENYGDNVNKLWHFTGTLNSSFERTIYNDMKRGYGPDDAYTVKDIPGTMINVTYDAPDVPVPDDPKPDDAGLVLPKTGGPGVQPFIIIGSTAMAASAATLFCRRRKLRRNYRSVTPRLKPGACKNKS